MSSTVVANSTLSYQFKHSSSPAHFVFILFFSRLTQFQVYIFINVEFHLICQLFVWSDLRYPNVTTGTKGCGDFTGKGVGIMGKAPWENKLQSVIPVCNVIPLFMDVGISICKCDIFLVHYFITARASEWRCDVGSLISSEMMRMLWSDLLIGGTCSRRGKCFNTDWLTSWWRFSSSPRRQQYIIKSLVICFVWQAGIYHLFLRRKFGKIRGRQIIKVHCADRNV